MGNVNTNFQPKEKFTGVYVPTAEQISFNKDWGNHRFTDDEAQKLLNGETISFQATAKSGNPYTARGSLKKQEYNGHEFWGFALAQNSVPANWAGHTFTQDEIDTLQSGGSVYVTDCVSKKTGKTFACTLSLGEEDGKKKLIPNFGK